MLYAIYHLLREPETTIDFRGELPSLKLTASLPPENRPFDAPKRKRSYSNHPFSDAMLAGVFTFTCHWHPAKVVGRDEFKTGTQLLQFFHSDIHVIWAIDCKSLTLIKAILGTTVLGDQPAGIGRYKLPRWTTLYGMLHLSSTVPRLVYWRLRPHTSHQINNI